MQRKAKLILIYSLLAVLWPGLASALGLGQLVVQSALNEPLRAEIELVTVTSEEFQTLKVGLAENILFQTNRLPVTDELKSLQFKPIRTGSNSYIRIHSSEPFRQANTAFFIKLESSSGVLVRKYKIALAAAAKSPVTVAEKKPEQVQKDQSPRVVVADGETLWSIASRYTTGTRISGSQMMLAIQAMNPNAFNAQNINELKKGSILIIPALEQARSIKSGQALNQVRQQVQQWKQHRAKQIVVPSTRLPTVLSDNKQKLSILAKTPNAGSDANPQSVELADMRQQNQLLQEQVGSKVQENLELRSRVDNLELVLKKQEAIIEVQNQQLARLQEILERLENLPPISPQASPLAGPKSSPQASAMLADSELNAGLKMAFDKTLNASQQAWLELKTWSQQQMQEGLERFENLPPISSQSSPKSSPQASAALADSELNADLKMFFDKASHGSQQTWLEFKAWSQQRSVAFLLGISSLSLLLLVMFMVFFLRRRKSASEPVSSADEPHFDPQAIEQMDESTGKVSPQALSTAAAQEPQPVILDGQVLKDLVDGVVVTNEPEPMSEVEPEPEDDLEELPEDAATKLDLVAILLEMGDVDSARESLRQVIADGDAEQVKRAQQILATID